MSFFSSKERNQRMDTDLNIQTELSFTADSNTCVRLQNDESEFISQAWNAIFLTAYHNFDEKWDLDQADNSPSSLDDPCGSDLSQLSLVFEKIYREVNEDIEKLQKTNESVDNLREKLQALRLSFCSTFSSDFGKENNPDIQEILDQLSIPLNSNKYLLESNELALKNEMLRHDVLKSYLTPLKDEQTFQENDLNRKQTMTFRNWHSQQLGVVCYTAANRLAVLRLKQPPFSKIIKFNKPPLVRGLVQRNSFESMILSKLQVVWSHNDMTDLSNTLSMAFAPGPLVACMQHFLRVDKALEEDMNRLRSMYAFEWDHRSRNLELLISPEGVFTATIHIDPTGMPKLMHIRSSKRCERENPNETDFTSTDEFRPPLSWSLDEWLMEVNDYCNSLTRRAES